jgi:HK97 family phage prohead protease
MDKIYNFLTEGFKSETIEIKDGKKYFITGYISTKDRDIYNDIVTENCLNSMLQQINFKNIKLDFEHEAWREENPAINPVGKIIEATKDEKGIFIKAQLNSNHSRFKEVWGSIKDGFLDAFSIAYKATNYSHKVIDGVKSRLLDGVELLNVALTGNPVNPACKMANVFMKSLEENKMTDEDVKAPEEEPVEEEEVVEEKSEVTELKSQLEEKSKEFEKQLELKSSEIEEKAKTIASLKKKLQETEAEVKSIKEDLDNPIIKAQLKSIEALKKVDGQEAKKPLDLI